jgi:hypothetical protein
MDFLPRRLPEIKGIISGKTAIRKPGDSGLIVVPSVFGSIMLNFRHSSLDILWE